MREARKMLAVLPEEEPMTYRGNCHKSSSFSRLRRATTSCERCSVRLSNPPSRDQLMCRKKLFCSSESRQFGLTNNT